MGLIKLCVTAERKVKSGRIMHALEIGSGGRGIMVQEDPSVGELFVVWGHRFNAHRLVPRAERNGTPWWLIDNGFHKPANQDGVGYYSLTSKGYTPARIQGADLSRLPVPAPEQMVNPNGHILITLPGRWFGSMMGFNYHLWKSTIVRRVQEHTDRRIVIRAKRTEVPFEEDLDGAWCLVTHSSKSAIGAIRAGIPAIVEQTNPAAPVCAKKLSKIERPIYPSPELFSLWWASLMAQQFTLDEMRAGLPWEKILHDQDHNSPPLRGRLQPVTRIGASRRMQHLRTRS